MLCRDLAATDTRADAGQGWNQSIVVQEIRAGNLEARLRIVSPAGLKHKNIIKTLQYNKIVQ